MNGILGNTVSVLQVWNKAIPIEGYNPSEYRYDIAGNIIAYLAYGDRKSTYGWEMDHILPVSQGGSDTLSNLRPLHWRANASRQ